MNVVVARLLFLAFVGLTGLITYNALYLQEQRSIALLPTVPKAAGDQGAPIAVGPRARDNRPPAFAGIKSRPRSSSPRSSVSSRCGVMAAVPRTASCAKRRERPSPITNGTTASRSPALPSDELLRHILLGETVSTGSVVEVADPVAAPQLKVESG